MKKQEKVPVLALGYGLPFRDGITKSPNSEEDESFHLHFETGLFRKSALVLVKTGAGGPVPFMIDLETRKGVIPLAFLVWMKEMGWRILDLADMMKSNEWMLRGEIKTKPIPDHIDVTGLEPIQAFPYAGEEGFSV